MTPFIKPQNRWANVHLRLPQRIPSPCQTTPCDAKRCCQLEDLFLATEVSLTEVQIHSSAFPPLLSQWCEKWADGELDTRFCSLGSIFAFFKGQAHANAYVCDASHVDILLNSTPAGWKETKLFPWEPISYSLLQSLLSDFKIFETLRVPEFTDIFRPEVTCQLDCNCTIWSTS